MGRTLLVVLALMAIVSGLICQANKSRWVFNRADGMPLDYAGNMLQCPCGAGPAVEDLETADPYDYSCVEMPDCRFTARRVGPELEQVEILREVCPPASTVVPPSDRW
jgi:hypothetical protein